MRALTELKEKHVNKRITLHAPQKYFNGEEHFDIGTFLKDNNADCLYSFTEENINLCPESCVLDYHPSSFESWNIVVSDLDGQTSE